MCVCACFCASSSPAGPLALAYNTYRILLAVLDNLNAAGGVARGVEQRHATRVGHHVVLAALEASIERAVGQVVVNGRLVDGHLANAAGD